MSDTCSVCMREVDDGVSCGECMPDYPDELRAANAKLVQYERIVAAAKAFMYRDSEALGELRAALDALAPKDSLP